MVGPPHALRAADVLGDLDVRQQGLSNEEAARRLAEWGPNTLPDPPRVSAITVLLSQLRSVIAYLLILAVVVSAAFGDTLEAAAIAAVLAINTGIGFITELRARQSMRALLRLEVPAASVWREGSKRTLDSRELVPGDIVEVEPGARVPADARLIDSTDLRTDEAPLTGESLPTTKTAEVVLPRDTPVGDRTNMIFMGTTVAEGLGRAVVIATGERTEVGKIGTLVSQVKVEPTPLERKLDVLGRRLVWLTLAIAAVVAGLGLANGVALDLVIETSIALAIAAVPEALPVVATIALAVGMQRMARRQALVRRLPAVESLGSATVVCTDKTRTLTSGRMAIVRLHAGGRDVEFGTPADATAGAAEVRALLEAAAAASRIQAETTHGDADEHLHVDPVDRAVLDAARRYGVSRVALDRESPEVDLIPFSSGRKFMASFRKQNGRIVAFVKGAPGAVAALVSEAEAAATTAAAERFAADGLRVLAAASGEVADTRPATLHGLSFLGTIGLADPPASGVKQTIDRLRQASLRTVMLTGDHRLTAEAIGRELGVIDEGATAIDGRAVDRLTPEDLEAAVTDHSVFSRISPEHKLRIVRALQAKGEIVAMLGDGVNDAAALRQADVGVAMGRRGTDAARQASAIVLQDDRFETVAAAVEEGRIIFDNIRKFVFYLFSCNVGEILLLLAAGLAALPLPLPPLQLLWLNLVTDTFPALALAMEPGDADVMRRPPRRPDEAMLSRRFLGSILFYGSLIAASSFAAFVWALARAPETASTMAFMTLALAQIAHLGNARRREAVLTPRAAVANRYALAGLATAVGLQASAYLVPWLAGLLKLEPLDATSWLVVIGLSAFPAVVGQAMKIGRS